MNPAQHIVDRLLEADENVDWTPDPETEPIRDVTRLDTELHRLGFAKDKKGRMALTLGRIYNTDLPKHRFVVWSSRSQYVLDHYIWSGGRWGKWEHINTSPPLNEDAFIRILRRTDFAGYAKPEEKPYFPLDDNEDEDEL